MILYGITVPFHIMGVPQVICELWGSHLWWQFLAELLFGRGLVEFVQRYIINSIATSSPYILLLFIVTSFNFHHIYVFTISNDSNRFILQCDHNLSIAPLCPQAGDPVCKQLPREVGNIIWMGMFLRSADLVCNELLIIIALQC